MSVPPEPPPGLYTVPPPLAITPPAPAASFSVDLDRAPQVLRDLEDARSQLDGLLVDATRLGRIDPGSLDEVSRDAATVIGAVAVGGPGNLVDALRGGIDYIDALIHAVQSELRAYREADRAHAFDVDA